MRKPPPSWLLSVPPLLYLLALFALPGLLMLLVAFRLPGDYGGLMPLWSDEDGALTVNLTLENFTRLVEDDIYLKLLASSLLYALLTTALCLVLGYPLAWMIARSRRRASSRYRSRRSRALMLSHRAARTDESWPPAAL